MDDRRPYQNDARFLAEMLASPSVDDATKALLREGQLGEYTLLEKLGEGGMGTVYKAVHTELDRLVAIKVMRQGPAEEDWAASRFRREIKAVASLDHPNIVRAYDARKIGDIHFLVMEHVDGLNLNELVERCGPLPVAEACELARQAALGLQAAHEHGLVHRDIKPSNLMLSRQGQVKILDLGLARVHAAPGLTGQRTAVGQVMGTPDYMAPEQASDSHAVDIRADIYSLGCTLYTLLTGIAPFSGPEYQGLLAKLAAHRERQPPPVRLVRSDVPDGVATVLDRMMAKTPEGRFATPADVAKALEPWTPGCDVCTLLSKKATPRIEPGRPKAGAVGRPLRRWLIAAGAMAVIVLVIVLALIYRPGHDAGLPVSPKNDGETIVASRSAKESDFRGAKGDKAAPAQSGWIVLSWTRPRMGKPNLWLFSPDGKRRRNLSNDPRYFDIHPKFSPAGRHIVFVRGESLNEPNAVYVCKSDGSELRALVAAQDKAERFASPVWVSNSLVYYSRDPKPDREPDMELWQVELSGGPPRLVFRFEQAVGKGAGLATDVSPDGRRLAIIAQRGGSPATADVYVTDRDGKNPQTVWEDRPDGWRDARALWSPDGTSIAWHHNFTRGMLGSPLYHGVGMARCEIAGKWSPRLQPQADICVTPLAWSPRGDGLLCARLHDPGQKMPAVTLFLMDDDFRSVRDLFELEATPWQPGQREMGRLADWAVVPPDLRIETAH